MRTFALTHVSDAALRPALHSVVAKECTTMAWVLARIAEFDARRLYLPAGYRSMHAYCVEELPFSEDAAYKRIQAARKAREFPVIFGELAAGRLHLGGVCLLAPHLTPQNAEELLAAAARQTKAKIAQLIAERFPQTEVMALVQPIREGRSESLAPGQVGEPVPDSQSARSVDVQLAPGQVNAPVPRPRVKPIAPGRFVIQFTIGQETHDLLQEAQALLSHAVPSGDSTGRSRCSSRSSTSRSSRRLPSRGVRAGRARTPVISRRT